MRKPTQVRITALENVYLPDLKKFLKKDEVHFSSPSILNSKSISIAIRKGQVKADTVLSYFLPSVVIEQSSHPETLFVPVTDDVKMLVRKEPLSTKPNKEVTDPYNGESVKSEGLESNKEEPIKIETNKKELASASSLIEHKDVNLNPSSDFKEGFISISNSTEHKDINLDSNSDFKEEIISAPDLIEHKDINLDSSFNFKEGQELNSEMLTATALEDLISSNTKSPRKRKVRS